MSRDGQVISNHFLTVGFSHCEDKRPYRLDRVNLGPLPYQDRYLGFQISIVGREPWNLLWIPLVPQDAPHGIHHAVHILGLHLFHLSRSFLRANAFLSTLGSGPKARSHPDRT